MTSKEACQNIICVEIKEERDRQDKKWGIQDHDEFKWLAILGEEVGEVNKAALENHFGSDSLDNYRKELVQVAAVAVAMIECHDRKSHNLNPRIFGVKNGE